MKDDNSVAELSVWNVVFDPLFIISPLFVPMFGCHLAVLELTIHFLIYKCLELYFYLL